MTKLLYFLFLLTFIGCASTRDKERNGIRKLYSEKKFQEGLEFLEKSKLSQDENNALLAEMERSLFLHTMGNYFASSEALNRAHKLLDEYFTVRVSKVLSKTYKGHLHEKSFIHFLQALNYLMIYQTGKIEARDVIPAGEEPVKKLPARELNSQERKQYLYKARAEIVAWDVFWKSYRQSHTDKLNFQHDLLAKVFGAHIHEALSTRNDDQIALILYKDAFELVKKRYKNYATYQDSKSRRLKNLKRYLGDKIVGLVQRVRPGSLKSETKKLGLNYQSYRKKAKRLGRRKNVNFVIWDGLAPEVYGKKYGFGMAAMMVLTATRPVRSSSSDSLYNFMRTVLGITALGIYHTGKKAHLNVEAGALHAESFPFQFEMPKVKDEVLSHDYFLEIRDKKQKVVYSQELALLSPFNDILKEIIEENFQHRYARKVAATAISHFTSLAGIYLAYKTAKKSKNAAVRLSAGLVAVGAYAVASRQINNKKADTRFWSTMPKAVVMDSIYLPKGEYSYQVKRGEISLKEGKFSVTKNSSQLVNIRSL